MSAPSPVVYATASQSPDNVYHALAVWAERADRRLLSAWAVVGWADALGIAVFLPRLWLLAMPLISVSALGVWGLAARRSRALDEAGTVAPVRRQALLAVRAAAVTIGTIAAIAAFFAAFLLVLGPRAGGPDG